MDTTEIVAFGLATATAAAGGLLGGWYMFGRVLRRRSSAPTTKEETPLAPAARGAVPLGIVGRRCGPGRICPYCGVEVEELLVWRHNHEACASCAWQVPPAPAL